MSNLLIHTTQPTETSSPIRTTAHRSEKIADHHLQRLAIVYVRQSTQQQVLEHRESTARQYALTDRAVALGWPSVAVEIIDEDQGLRDSQINQAPVTIHKHASGVPNTIGTQLIDPEINWFAFFA